MVVADRCLLSCRLLLVLVHALHSRHLDVLWSSARVALPCLSRDLLHTAAVDAGDSKAVGSVLDKADDIIGDEKKDKRLQVSLVDVRSQSILTLLSGLVRLLGC